jgi:hypothetical protein
VILFSFPLQQWLNERVSLLCYTYIVCHVRKAMISPAISPILVGQLFFQPHLIPYREHSRNSTIGSDRTTHENHSNRDATRSRQGYYIYGEITSNVARNYLSSYFVNNSQCRHKVKMTFFFCLGKHKRSIWAQNFQKYRRELKIVGVRKLTWNHFRGEDHIIRRHPTELVAEVTI